MATVHCFQTIRSFLCRGREAEDARVDIARVDIAVL